MRKAEIIDRIKNDEMTAARNGMGCLESWYNPYFAISKTFPIEEIEKMSQRELNNLVKLANTIAEGLY